MPWQKDGKQNIYNRNKLYDEVWAKLKAGKTTKKIPLPKTEGQTRFVGSRTLSSTITPESIQQPLSFLPKTERQQVISTAKDIVMPTENARLHKKITAYKSVVAAWNKNDRKAEADIL